MAWSMLQLFAVAAPVDGPPPGTDSMVQARTGPTRPSVGGTGWTVASLMTVLDVLGGFLGTRTVTAALVHRQISGDGVAVESSLRGASRLPSPHPAGRTRLGFSRDAG